CPSRRCVRPKGRFRGLGRLLWADQDDGCGSIARRPRFEMRPLAYSTSARRSISSNDRLHRILFISTNSANSSLQSTSVTGPENRQRQVWVESANSISEPAAVRSVL